ncbi:hypothetical protein ACW9I8_23775, partial [Pseudomonas reactans]
RNPICESRWGFVLGGRKVQSSYINLPTLGFLCAIALIKRVISTPFGNSMQSVSAFLVWCSTFSQGLSFHPQDAASTFFNEML